MKRLTLILCTICVSLIAFNAHALIINPTTFTGTMWNWLASGPDPYDEQNLKIGDVETITGAADIEWLYKSEFDDGAEEGFYFDDYTTAYFPVASDDASGATISNDGPNSIGSPSYLYVKDGDHDPRWYLFDLSSVGWDGAEVLELENFWPDVTTALSLDGNGNGNGAISHVAIAGTAPVPEPATMLLFGTGLVGLAGARFRKKK